MEWKLGSPLGQPIGTVTLETFLGGMETCLGGKFPHPGTPLKPSLVEWKRNFRSGFSPRQGSPLKPSLVEWKRVSYRDVDDGPNSLKPSLVEWKHQPLQQQGRTGLRLETFLGGMETCRPEWHRPRCACLETFLGGMETILQHLAQLLQQLP